MNPVLNITNQFPVKYPVANLIFPNKTVILLTKRNGSSSSQQIALLAGMAFIGGIVAGLLIRFIYCGIVKYFMSNMDQLSTSQRQQDQGNNNPSFVDDNFRYANDEPPDYLTVVTETTRNSVLEQQNGGKPANEIKDSRIAEENPPTYISIVSNFARVVRSASA